MTTRCQNPVPGRCRGHELEGRPLRNLALYEKLIGRGFIEADEADAVLADLRDRVVNAPSHP